MFKSVTRSEPKQHFGLSYIQGQDQALRGSKGGGGVGWGWAVVASLVGGGLCVWQGGLNHSFLWLYTLHVLKDVIPLRSFKSLHGKHLWVGKFIMLLQIKNNLLCRRSQNSKLFSMFYRKYTLYGGGSVFIWNSPLKHECLSVKWLQ